MHLNPAEYVIRIFKGVRATARAAGRSATAVSKWRKAGRVPVQACKAVLKAAKKIKADLTAHDLIYGRKVK